jgi:pimeloyl-ACP methyl ester carboxylesterase
MASVFFATSDRRGPRHDSVATDALPELSIRTILVDGSPVRYAFASCGFGPSVLFLHGWGLSHRSYHRAIKALAGCGYQVSAPALPSFGGSVDLAAENQTMSGYAEWVQRFCVELGMKRTTVVGHSFGGGVAIRLGVVAPRLVDGLVLLNSIGGRWSYEGTSAAMQDRPWWDWLRNVPSDLIALAAGLTPRSISELVGVVEDFVPQVVRNPLATTRVGRLARTADLSTELAVLRARKLPIEVIHAEHDGVIPRSSFDSICDVLEHSGQIVSGNHSWPMTHPEVFARVIDVFASALPGARQIPTRRKNAK